MPRRRADSTRRSKPGRRRASCVPRRRRPASPAPASHCSTACRSSGWRRPSGIAAGHSNQRRSPEIDEMSRTSRFSSTGCVHCGSCRADRRLTFQLYASVNPDHRPAPRALASAAPSGTNRPQSGQTRGAQHTGSPPKSSKFRSAGGLAAGGAAGTVTAGSGEFSVTEELPAHRRRQPAPEARRRPAALDHQPHVGAGSIASQHRSAASARDRPGRSPPIEAR